MRLLMSADDIRARPAEWARTRDDLVTASDMGSIAGLDDAYSTPFAVYLRKIMHDDKPDSIALRIGRHYEPLVLELFGEANPDLAITPGGLYVSTGPGREWQAATFDALAYGQSSAPIPVQAKTTYSFSALHDDGSPVWGEPPDGEIPGPYLAQVMGEIDVADAEYGYLPVLPTGTRGAPRVYRVWRNDDEIAAMRRIGELFYECLIGHTPPPISWRDEDTRALKRMYRQVEYIDAVVPKRLGRRARAAYAAYRLAKRRLGLVENELRARMGPATRAVCRTDDPDRPDVIATRSLYDATTLDVGGIRDKHPRMAKRFERKTPIDKMLIKQPRGQS